MTPVSFFFLTVGATYATAQFMRFVLWLDAGRSKK